MTDVTLLRDKIAKSGYKMQYIAQQLGITPQGLYLKLNNTNQFRADEIQILCRLLHITDAREMKRIFFTNSVDEVSTKEA